MKKSLSYSLGTFAVIVMAVAQILPSAARADVTYLGMINMPGRSTDATTDSTRLPDHIAQNSLNGYGSAIAYTGTGHLFGMLVDRGPNAIPYAGGQPVDNTVNWHNRIQLFSIRLRWDGQHYHVDQHFRGTTPLVTPQGFPYTGLSTAGDPAMGGVLSGDPTENLRLDPEGLRIGPRGRIFVSDEYGPCLYVFNQAGKRIGSYRMPKGFYVANPGPTKKSEKSNTTGRSPNHGLEGLAVSPDGKEIYAILQSSLIQDGGGKHGFFTRIIQWHVDQPDQPAKQYACYLDTDGYRPLEISELAALNSHQLLILARDGYCGKDLTSRKVAFLHKYVVAVDLKGASDVSDIHFKPRDPICPKGVKPVRKTMLMEITRGEHITPASFDRLKADFTNAHPFDQFPEKIEGLTLGPDLTTGPLAGDHLMLISVDNDFLNHDNQLLAFAFSDADLRTLGLSAYQPRRFHFAAPFKPALKPVELAGVSPRRPLPNAPSGDDEKIELAQPQTINVPAWSQRGVAFSSGNHLLLAIDPIWQTVDLYHLSEAAPHPLDPIDLYPSVPGIQGLSAQCAPTAVAVDPTRPLALVTVPGQDPSQSGTLVGFDLRRETLGRCILSQSVGCVPSDVAVSGDGRWAVICDQASVLKRTPGQIEVADLQALKMTDQTAPVSTTPVPGLAAALGMPVGEVEPTCVAIDPDSRFAAVTCRQSDAVALVDLSHASANLAGILPLIYGAHPHGIAIINGVPGPDGRQASLIAVAEQGRFDRTGRMLGQSLSLTWVDAHHLNRLPRLMARMRLGRRDQAGQAAVATDPTAVAMGRLGSRVIAVVTLKAIDQLLCIDVTDPTNPALIGRVQTGRRPVSVSLTPRGDHLLAIVGDAGHHGPGQITLCRITQHRTMLSDSR